MELSLSIIVYHLFSFLFKSNYSNFNKIYIQINFTVDLAKPI